MQAQGIRVNYKGATPTIADFVTTYLSQEDDEEMKEMARLELEEFKACGPIAKTAVLYTVGYLYEHREDADHKALTMTLRSLLMGIRREGF